MRDATLKKREIILKTTVALAEKHGLTNITRIHVAAKTGVSAALISHYFGSGVNFQTAILQYAIDHDIDVIIAQGLVAKHPLTKKLDRKIKIRALMSLVGNK